MRAFGAAVFVLWGGAATAGEYDEPRSLAPLAIEDEDEAERGPDELDRLDGPGVPSEVSFADEEYAVTVTRRRLRRSATDTVLSLDAWTHAPPPSGTGTGILRRAPGVYVSQHSGEGKGHQIFLRGFDAEHGQDVAVSVNGVPINEVANVHAQGYVDLGFVVPEAVRRVRVLEGPFDPRQGDFAVAGSIDFELGLDREGVFARASAGQFGLLRGVAGFRPRGAPAQTFVVAEAARASEFGPARAWGRASLLGAWRLPVGEDSYFQAFVAAASGRFDSAGTVRLDDVQAGRIDRFGAYDPNQGGAGDRSLLRLELGQEDEIGAASLSVYAMSRAFRLRSNFTGFLLDARGDRIEQEQHTVTLGASAAWRRRLLSAVGVELGLSVRHDRTERTQERLRVQDGAVYGTDLDDRLGVTDFGAWLDLELQPLPNLAVRGGARVEVLSYLIDGSEGRREAFGDQLAPKVTVEWRMNPEDFAPDLRSYASYGRGFRSPDPATLGQGERSPLTVVDAGELGLRADFGALELVGAAFVTLVEEDLVFDHATGRRLFDGPSLRYGGAVRGQLSLGPPLMAGLSVTYTRAEKPDEGGTLLPFVPPLVVQVDAEGTWPIGRLFDRPLSATGRAALFALGPRPLPFGEESDPVWVLEAGLGLELGAYALSVEAFNLFDVEWRDAEFVYASDFRTNAGRGVPSRHFTAGRPLTAQVSFTVRFEEMP